MFVEAMTPKEKTAESVRIFKIIEERVANLVERNAKVMMKNLRTKTIIRQEFRIKNSGVWDTTVVCLVPESKKEPVDYYWFSVSEYFVNRSSKSYDNCGRGFYLIHTEYPGTLFDFTPHMLSRTTERLLSDTEKINYAMFGEEYKIVRKVRENAKTDCVDEEIDNEMKRYGIMNPKMKIMHNKRKVVHIGKFDKEDMKKILCVALNMMCMESLNEIHEKKDENGNNYLTVHMRAGQLEGFVWKMSEKPGRIYPEGYVCFKTFVDNEILKNDQIAYSTQIDNISTVTNVEEEIHRRMKNALEVSQSKEEKEQLIFQKDMAIRNACEKSKRESFLHRPVKLPECFIGSNNNAKSSLENELKRICSSISKSNNK